MTSDKIFYEDLARAPELPPHLYINVRRTIERHTMFMRTMVSLAATVVVALGITVMAVSRNGSGVAITAEVASELQFIKEFGSGSDIANDLDAYALYDGELSD